MGLSLESRRPLSFWACGACSLLSVALGALFVLLGVWATHLQQRFTPIYTEIVCRMTSPKLEHFSTDGGLAVVLASTTSCDNPNPYSVELRSTKVQRVYMGSDMTLVASVTDIPPATLPAKGRGSVEAKIRLKPTGGMFGSLVSGLFGKTIPIYMENSMEVDIDIDFLFGHFRKAQEVDKKCGLNFQVNVFRGSARAGPMVCADSFGALAALPPVDRPLDGEIRIAAVGMAEDELDKAREAKDVGLATAMGVGYGLGLLLLLCSSCGLWRLCRRRPSDDSAREVGDLAKGSAKGEDGGFNTTCEMAATQIGAPSRRAEEATTCELAATQIGGPSRRAEEATTCEMAATQIGAPSRRAEEAV